MSQQDYSMPTMLHDLGIDRLSIDERIALVTEIWDSIPSGQTLLTTEQRQELDRRIADHEANPGDVVSWDEVKLRTRALLNSK